MEEEYEKLRRARIAQNRAKLEQLALQREPIPPLPSIGHKVTNPRVKTQRRSPKTPTRSSSRIAGQAPLSYRDLPGSILDSSPASKRVRKSLSTSPTKQEPISYNTTNLSRIPTNSARNYPLDPYYLVPEHVGQAIYSPNSQLKRHMIQTLTLRNSHLAFNRMSGICALSDSILLFINLPNSEPIRNSQYENTFSEQGKYIRWFGQNSHSEESPIIQRILHASQRKSTEKVIILVRAPEKYIRDFYVFLGPVQYKSHKTDVHPIQIVFEFEHYSILQDSKLFQSIIHAEYEKMAQLASETRLERK
mmetsp:Transcript_12948/g.23285  ORF Transcript_12948/g.23285 Transcript_12948/m.23285 type:complete len:305 (-) Transcript_12948:250-1164(-)